MAYPKVSQIISPVQLGVPSELYEWTVNDTAKAINAQQCAAITQVERLIWKRFPLTPTEKARLDYINSQYQAINDYSALRVNADTHIYPHDQYEMVGA